MDFKFNFQLKEDTRDTDSIRYEKLDVEEKVNPYREITIKEVQEKWNSDFLYEVDRVTITADDSDLIVIVPCSRSVIDNLSKEKSDLKIDKVASDSEHCDLVSNVYEGGFKIWECTLDLISYIRESKIDFKQKKILDLGCGVGLLGLFALTQCGASRVDFQDYNHEVLLHSTGPTVAVNYIRHFQKSEPPDVSSESPSKSLKFSEVRENLESNKPETHEFISKPNLEDEKYIDDLLKGILGNENLQKRVCFHAGDWKHVQKVVEQENIKYDVILSSETIYNLSAYEKLHNFLRQALSSEGTAYVAAKAHYFGVGGGVVSWRHYVQSLGVFEVVVAKEYEDNLQRMILKINFKS